MISSIKSSVANQNFVGRAVIYLTNVALTLLLLNRWAVSGHFPLSNLYESLIFLSWSFTMIFFVASLTLPQTILPIIGSSIAPITLLTCGFAFFCVPSELQKAQPLVPALQSNWLIMHVSVMILSYASLLLGSLFALALLLAIHFFHPNYRLKSITDSPRSIVRGEEEWLTNQKEVLQCISSPTSSPQGNASFGQQRLPSLPVVVEQYSLSPSVKEGVTPKGYKSILKKDTKEQCSGTKGQDAKLLVEGSASSASPSSFVPEQCSLAPSLPQRGTKEGAKGGSVSLSFSSSAFSFAKGDSPLSSFAFGMQSKAEEEGKLAPLLPVTFGERGTRDVKPLLQKKIIKLNLLDDLSYRFISFGFAFLTLGIISGAVWANFAWGSYWSWDPKETWAFITWLTYAIYLHLRISKGWYGEQSAFVAIFGFFIVWFCYLGVNLFGKGLHSYAFV